MRCLRTVARINYLWPFVKNRVVIKSMAVVTPLGSNPEMVWTAIRSDQRLTDRGVISEDALANLRCEAETLAMASGFAFSGAAIVPLAERAAIPRIARKCGVNGAAGFAVPEIGKLDRSLELGAIACLRALTEAGWSADICAQHDTALLLATSKGPVLRVLEACAALENGPENMPPHLAWHVAMGPYALQMVLSNMIQPGGPAQTHVAACAGSFIALQHAWNAIREGEFKRAILVAADASIHPVFEHSFENLGVLAKPGEDGKRRCQPFAAAGNGFFITEAAAAICLESADSGKLELEHCWLGGDATHLLAIDPQAHSLTRGLRACAAGQNVTFVHAHAAGTQHDQVELAAIRRACGAEPAVFSHKRWMGHTLGASGMVGLIISALCHQKAMLPDGRPIAPPARSITIAQGFGGHIGMCVLTG
ncbi:MAG: beta-ketoacyl synthase N-terminal-like domain-containing protein [Phycisphaerae bacterium]